MGYSITSCWFLFFQPARHIKMKRAACIGHEYDDSGENVDPADLDTGFLPGVRHLEFEGLVKGMTTLSELLGKFQELAGFEVGGRGGE